MCLVRGTGAEAHIQKRRGGVVSSRKMALMLNVYLNITAPITLGGELNNVPGRNCGTHSLRMQFEEKVDFVFYLSGVLCARAACGL